LTDTTTTVIDAQHKAAARRTAARINARALRRSKGRCPPEGAYLAAAPLRENGETAPQRNNREADELGHQQTRLKREAAGRRQTS
jgi:hypothetical protein